MIIYEVYSNIYLNDLYKKLTLHLVLTEGLVSIIMTQVLLLNVIMSIVKRFIGISDMISITDGEGNTTLYNRDILGRTISITEEQGKKRKDHLGIPN